MEKMMNNINIKSKKTRTLNNNRFILIEDKYDPFYANIYCLMASKRTNSLSKNELKRDLAKMYDARLTVSQNIENNVINIRYTLSSILDQFLPDAISTEVDQIFKDVMAEIEFTDEEIISSCRELSLYIQNYKDNKQNLASNKLNEIISLDGMTLSLEAVTEFYNNPDPQATKNWISKVFISECQTLNFNNGHEQFKQQHTTLPYAVKQYKPADDVVIDLGLDQTYVAIGYQLPSTNVTINNIISLVFGGGVYSKLFKVVREEMSLSYNIRSSLATENLLRVNGGVNNQQVDEALIEIDNQLKVLQNGDFKSEFELAKTNYIESLKRSKANEMSYISMYGANYLTTQNRTHDSIISEIEELQIEEVIEALNNIKKLATVLVK